VGAKDNKAMEVESKFLAIGGRTRQTAHAGLARDRGPFMDEFDPAGREEFAGGGAWPASHGWVPLV
jgi:hypothetical protein